jgi:hypothetical protein
MALAQILTNFEHLPEDVREKLAELDLELSEGQQSAYIHFLYPLSGSDLSKTEPYPTQYLYQYFKNPNHLF